MFEASSTERTAAPAEAVWALWEDPARWPEWNERFERAEAEAGLEPGVGVRTKLRRGGRMRFEIAALEPERRLAYEARFPGARYGYEHTLAPEPDGGCEITHRVYVSGPAAGFWALMLGRRRIRESAGAFDLGPLLEGSDPF